MTGIVIREFTVRIGPERSYDGKLHEETIDITMMVDESGEETLTPYAHLKIDNTMLKYLDKSEEVKTCQKCGGAWLCHEIVEKYQHSGEDYYNAYVVICNDCDHLHLSKSLEIRIRSNGARKIQLEL